MNKSNCKIVCIVFLLAFLTSCMGIDVPAQHNSSSVFENFEKGFNLILNDFIGNAFIIVLKTVSAIAMSLLAIKICIISFQSYVSGEFGVKIIMQKILFPLFLFGLVFSVMQSNSSTLINNINLVPEIFEELALNIVNNSKTSNAGDFNLNGIYATLDAKIKASKSIYTRECIGNEKKLKTGDLSMDGGTINITNSGRSTGNKSKCLVIYEKNMFVTFVLWVVLNVLMVYVFACNLFLSLTLKFWLMLSPIFIYARFFDLMKETFTNFVKSVFTIALQKMLLIVSLIFSLNLFESSFATGFIPVVICAVFSFILVTGSIKLGSAMFGGITGGSSSDVSDGIRSAAKFTGVGMMFQGGKAGLGNLIKNLTGNR